MQQIEKKSIIKELWRSKQSETDKLHEFLSLCKSGRNVVSKYIKKHSREYFNDFINLCADIEIIIDQFRVQYAIEIESVKVSKLRKFQKKDYK